MIQTSDETKVVLVIFPEISSRSKRGLNRTDPKSELIGLRPQKRLPSRFGRIENVKNFDVEKWYNFNFLFAESFK